MLSENKKLKSQVFWILAFFILQFGFYNSLVAQTEKANPKANPSAEKYILQRIREGKIADLNIDKFKTKEERIISAKFLEDLLTGVIKITNMRRKEIQIENAVIYDDLDLSNTTIPYSVYIGKTTYYGSILFFLNTKVEGVLHLYESIFELSAKPDRPPDEYFSFSGLTINGDFSIHLSEFKNKDILFNFDNMNIGRNFFLREAKFDGRATFYNTDVKGNLFAEKVEFNKPDQEISFDNMQIGRVFFLNEAVFEGPVSFVNANINISFEPIATKFKGSTWFENLKTGRAFFSNTEFKGFYSISGMNYNFITADPQNNWIKTLDLIKNSFFSADVYATLESVYLKEGKPEQAREVFIAFKQRERELNLNGLSWWQNYFLDWTVGYGRKPWLAFVWSSLFVFFGWIVFRGKWMEQTDSGGTHSPEKAKLTWYSPFWYSLDLFLPFVDLQVDNKWKPKDNAWFLKRYQFFHTLAGWILIPIGLAALTGIIK